MDRKLMSIMVIALMVTLPIAIIIIHQIDKKDKLKNNISSSPSNSKKSYKIIYRLYQNLSRFPLTKAYMGQIRHRYDILYPGEENQIVNQTMKTALATWIACFITIVFICLRKPSLFNLIVGIFLIYVINKEIIGYMAKRTEVRLLEDMVVFLSEVRHNYHVNRMVDDAILNSMDDLGYEMKIHGYKLYDILVSNNLKEEVTKYNSTTHNKYLKMFLSLSIGVIEYSDKKVHGQYLFTSNVENLIKEINIEILKQKKLHFLFSGVSFVTVSAIIPIDGIKQFGISMMPELDSFYNGSPGIILAVLTIITTSIIYTINNRLKDTSPTLPKDYSYLKKIEKNTIVKQSLDNYCEKNYGKMILLGETLKRMGDNITPRQLLLKRMIATVLISTMSLMFAFYIHENNKNNLLNKPANISSLFFIHNSNQKENIEEIILSNVNLYKDNKDIRDELILRELKKEKSLYNTKANEEISGIIIGQIKDYQREYIKWYELILCFAAGLIGFYLPYWMILLRKRILSMNMEDEINQFHSIIYMIMFTDHITIKDLLEELELFAVVFKQSIQECINNYNSGEIEALTKLKDKENHPPFRRLVDNLIRCDAMSMERAFDEISSDRESYHDRRKQENEISIQKRADIAKPLSWIPAILVMTYLTLPLLLASLNELQGFKEAMRNI
ncbi:MAG: hypothetical protein GX915_02855 [Clostridiales bacterium]|nr:hypothetical protein [Clostridiales bacterium]